MSREKAAYRDNLEQILLFLNNKYGDHRQMLGNKDIREFTGLSYEYVRKNYMNGSAFVSAATFARAIS